MFGKNKEKEVKVESNFNMIHDMFEESEKFLTKTIADMVSQAGGVTLDDVVDPTTASALKNTFEYYDRVKTQTLAYAVRMDQKELELDRKLEKQKMLLEEQKLMLEELLKRK